MFSDLISSTAALTGKLDVIATQSAKKVSNRIPEASGWMIRIICEVWIR